MGILDEAIREHLELKRQHGAADSDLKQLEDEAFGPPARPGSEPPDAASEAPTQFMTHPEAPGEASDAGGEGARREVSIADLQEAPDQTAPAEEPEELAPAEEPDEEEQPAMEHEVVADAPEAAEPESAGPSTEERHAISEQPTEFFDVEEELEATGPPNPTDEELVEEEISEPRLAPTDPLAGLDEGDVEPTVEVAGADEDDEDDEFWNEQRLSDELDQALEAPLDPEPELEEDEELEEEPEPAEEQPEAEAPRHGDDDVLEDTPDFLEDAPEDDQLWFEQKPPKDFDFDD